MVCMKNRVAYIQYLHAKQAINPLWNKEIPAVWWQRVFSSCEYLHPQGHQHARWGRRWPCSDRRQNTSERSKVKKGHRVYTDNFYSKPTTSWNPAAAENYSNRNCEGQFQRDTWRQQGQASCRTAGVKARKCELVFTSFWEKKSQTKPVLLLSTGHNATSKTIRKRYKDVSKPDMILDYNKHMGGVDVSDKMVCH